MNTSNWYIIGQLLGADCLAPLIYIEAHYLVMINDFICKYLLMFLANFFKWSSGLEHIEKIM